MQTKYNLEIVGTESKEWKSKEGMIMPFFPLKKGSYTMVKDDFENRWFLIKKLSDKESFSILMYKELIDQLLIKKGTILVDEDILKVIF